ncbi:MAG: fibrillarin-like rRNA/tRNA 2'-O-methyltransferase [archaeon]
MDLKEIFPGVWQFEKHLLTLNKVKGVRVYGEKLFTFNDIEYRKWDPFHSKLAAGIKKGLKDFPVKPGSSILYLGCAEGTTCSHLSDIVGEKGLIVGLDFSPKAMQEYIKLCSKRNNLQPLLENASSPQNYSDLFNGKFDVLIQDIAQRNQAEIFLKNSIFLKDNGFGLISFKAKSIDSVKEINAVFEREVNLLKEKFKVLQTVNLSPFEKDHILVLCQKN